MWFKKGGDFRLPFYLRSEIVCFLPSLSKAPTTMKLRFSDIKTSEMSLRTPSVLNDKSKVYSPYQAWGQALRNLSSQKQ